MSSVAVHESLVIGVDVGGTKVAAGVVDPTGEILCQTRNPMAAHGSDQQGLAAVMEAIEAASQQAARTTGSHNLIKGIGICSPGPLDPKAGIVINPPNLPCWRNFPLVSELARTYRVRVKLDNDANAAGLAEALWGAGRGYKNVFYATLGTGIGTAILFDGHVYHGRTGAAAEGGHMSIDYRGPRCGCGKPGCIEVLASGPAIARRAQAKLGSGCSSSMLDLARGEIGQVTSEIVGQAHRNGDPVATKVLRETVELLTLWLGNIVDLLEPDIMIVGGGVAAMMQPFFNEIADRLPSCCVNQRCNEIPLVMARYGADSGIAGGAALCFSGTELETLPSTVASASKRS